MALEPQDVNEEYKEYVAYDIVRAIKQARKGAMELGLDDIAIILKEALNEDEILSLKAFL